MGNIFPLWGFWGRCISPFRYLRCDWKVEIWLICLAFMFLTSIRYFSRPTSVLKSEYVRSLLSRSIIFWNAFVWKFSFCWSCRSLWIKGYFLLELKFWLSKLCCSSTDLICVIHGSFSVIALEWLSFRIKFIFPVFILSQFFMDAFTAKCCKGTLPSSSKTPILIKYVHYVH